MYNYVLWQGDIHSCLCSGSAAFQGITLYLPFTSSSKTILQVSSLRLRTDDDHHHDSRRILSLWLLFVPYDGLMQPWLKSESGCCNCCRCITADFGWKRSRRQLMLICQAAVVQGRIAANGFISRLAVTYIWHMTYMWHIHDWCEQ